MYVLAERTDADDDNNVSKGRHRFGLDFQKLHPLIYYLNKNKHILFWIIHPIRQLGALSKRDYDMSVYMKNGNLAY